MGEEVKVDIFKQTSVPLHVDLEREENIESYKYWSKTGRWLTECLKFEEFLNAAFSESSCLFRIVA